MQRVAIRLYGETEWYSFPINPLEFDNVDGYDYSQLFTVDGRSIEQYPIFDGRIRTMTWKGLANKEPYQSFVAAMKAWCRSGVYELRLGDLSGNEGDNSVQYIKIINVFTVWRPGAGPYSAESHLCWDTIQLQYTPTAPPSS